ncbi:MAG: O-phosphoserine--tRNA ligase [Candidatus Methanofastidiosia archaeon]
MFSVEEILKRAKKDFFKEWKNSGKYFEGERSFILPSKRGKEHLLSKYSLKAREILLDMGFDEVFLKQIFSQKDVEKQFGPEAPAILDRLYYLAVFPRPDIGISEEKKQKIQEKISSLDFEKLKVIFRDYKLDKIDPGDLSEVMTTRLQISPEDVVFLLKEAFPDVLNLKPQATDFVLNSHFTTAWFPTLAQMVNKATLPVMLFTAGWRFRREQKEDPLHLRAHYNLSMVVMDKGLTLADGMYITKEFFKRMGFEKLKFKKKPNQAVYYAYGTNYEVFVKDERFGWVEITEIGMYSPIALAQYRIPYPVYNSGPGLGRLVMLSEDINDLRQLHHPEFYSFSFSDEEIARSIFIVEKSENKEMENFINSILLAAEKYGNEKSPCKFQAFEGKIMGQKIKAWIKEIEENTMLLGPAAFNKIYVFNGSIYGIPSKGLNEKLKNVALEGISTDFSYCKTFVLKVAKEVEKMIDNSFEGRKEFRLGMVKRLSDVNLDIPEDVRTYIQMKNSKIDIRGPVFFTVEVEIIGSGDD